MECIYVQCDEGIVRYDSGIIERCGDCNIYATDAEANDAFVGETQT